MTLRDLRGDCCVDIKRACNEELVSFIEAFLVDDDRYRTIFIPSDKLLDKRLQELFAELSKETGLKITIEEREDLKNQNE